MKRVFFFLAFALVSSISSESLAQVRLGVKGALNLANLSAEGTTASKALLAPQAGIVLYSSLENPLFFQTGLLYNVKGAKDSESGVDVQINYSFLELPVNVGFQIPVTSSIKVSPYAGAYVGYAFKGTAKIGGLSFDIFDTDLGDIGEEEFDAKRMDFGANIGVGLHFNNRIILSGQYSHGLANLSSDPDKVNTRTTSLGLTFLF